MAKTVLATAADADCVAVVEYLKAQTMYPAAPSGVCVEKTREIHRLTHSLVLWRFRLKRIPDHGQVFIEEIASDAVQILPQLVTGFVKPFKLLARGFVENALRHIYFIDHRIEFEKMNRLPKWYVSVEELFDYALDHPSLRDAEKQFDAINKMKMLYADLSAAVHGRRVQDFQMKIALSKITYGDAMFTEEAKTLARCTEAVNYTLAAFHLTQFRSFGVADRKIILSTLSQTAKKALTGL
jgi:hypothetical protein